MQKKGGGGDRGKEEVGIVGWDSLHFKSLNKNGFFGNTDCLEGRDFQFFN